MGGAVVEFQGLQESCAHLSHPDHSDRHVRGDQSAAAGRPLVPSLGHGLWSPTDALLAEASCGELNSPAHASQIAL